MSTLSTVLSGSDLTPAEVETARGYLTETASTIRDATAGMANTQWRFKPAPDRWSIAEILEHVVIVESLIHGIVRRMPRAPVPPADWNQMQVDAAIPITVPSRAQRFTAPDRIAPTGQMSGPEWSAKFLDARNETIKLLSAPALRGHVLPHPVAGPWDGYQWLLAAAAHSARHADQIREIKADPSFPRGN